MYLVFRKDSTESPQKIFNTNSPNKCHHGPGSDINVLYIGQDNDIAIEDFEKLVAKNNMISVTLIIELYKGCLLYTSHKSLHKKRLLTFFLSGRYF